MLKHFNIILCEYFDDTKQDSMALRFGHARTHKQTNEQKTHTLLDLIQHLFFCLTCLAGYLTMLPYRQL
jgi:hypothetical protein